MAVEYERFVVTSGQTVALAAGTYTNPQYHDGNGAAGEVQENGTLIAIGTAKKQIAFAGNTASNSGGAVYISGGSATFGNVVFSGNSAGFGGALSNGAGTTTITGATFSENVGYEGGAICNAGSNAEMDFFDTAVFIGNVGNTGGAIFNFNGGGLSVMNFFNAAIFSGNTATGDGGAIYNYARMDFSNTVTFTGNTAKNGGAIFSYGGTVTFASATFSDNVTANDGGAIYNGQYSTMSFADVIFSANTATNGGAIYNGGTIALSNAAFYNNYAVSSNLQGGAVVNEASGTITSVDNVVFSGNSAYWGGALCNSGVIQFSGATFSGNHGDQGGGIYMLDGNLTVTDHAVFTDNVATLGAGYFNDGTATLNNVCFSGNTASGGGGLWNCGLLPLSICHGTFSHNIAYGVSDGGGAIMNAGPATVIDVTFIGNTATAKGGAICNRYDDYNHGVLTLTDVSFVGNAASTGGAMNVDGGTVTLSGATFANNIATTQGGAINISNGGTVTGTNVSFTGNSAGNSGGAIYNAGTINFAGATFTGNIGRVGGAIRNAAGGTINFTGSSVSFGNMATGAMSDHSYGGAISNNGTINFTDASVSFTGNTSGGVFGDGGAIDNSGTLTFTGSSVSFTGNTASNAGGAIFNAAGSTINFTSSSVTFSGNTATVGGGAIYNYRGTVNFSGTIDLATKSDTWVNTGYYPSMEYSAATVNWVISGGLDQYGTIKNFERYSNLTTEVEGVQQLLVKQTITVSETQAVGNYVIATGDLSDLTNKDTFTVKTAEDETGVTLTVGGESVVYNGLTYSLANIDNSQLVLSVYTPRIVVQEAEPHTAWPFYELVTGGTYTCPVYAGNGGAVYVSAGGTVTGSNVTFAGNTANTNGGAIFNSGTVNFTGATFTGNVADNIGAIENYNGTINFIGSSVTFAGNSSGHGSGAIKNNGTINFTGSSVTFTGNTASGPGGAIKNNGTINFTGSSVTFTGNTASGSGGAIYNKQGTVNFSGTIDLATASDTWVNIGYSVEYAATVNWDITNGLDQYATIKNFERYSNADEFVKQTITVTANQAVGDYVIATGDLSSVTGKDTFYLTLDGTTLSDAFKVNTLGYLYSGRYYSLTKTDSALTLTVADHYEVTTPTGLGGVDTTLAGGTYNRIVLGGERELGNHIEPGYSGSYTISITDGVFASDFMGGDAAAGHVLRTGSITVNVSGGTFAKSLAAGSYFAPNGGVISGSATITGDLTLNITGGTFAGRVYGGNSAMKDKVGNLTVLNGSTNLTINATSSIYFGECIAAGSRGHGYVSGSTNVTVTGAGDNLHFAGASVLFGGCSGDYYNVVSGVRTTANTQVMGARNLTFDQFTGDFGAEIRMFSDITFTNDASVNFTDADLDLKEMENWYFDCTSRATNLNKNKFAGDAISVDTTDLTDSWTLLSGAADAFADLGSASSVTLGGGTATYNGTAWVTDSFSLALQDNGTKLVISKLA